MKFIREGEKEEESEEKRQKRDGAEEEAKGVYNFHELSLSSSNENIIKTFFRGKHGTLLSLSC